MEEPTWPTAPTADELSERLFASLVPGLELLCVDLGRRLGLYEVLAASDITAHELAERAGVPERYAREWLEQQAVAGILTVDATADAAARRFTLPPGVHRVLLDATDRIYAMGAPTVFGGIAAALPALEKAYRGERPISYAAYGEGVRRGLEYFNRPAYTNDLATWIAELPDIVGRLGDGGRVVDVGCGTGWSTVALASALPGAEIVGVDLDTASLDEARAHIADAGLADRVRVVRADASDATALRAAVGSGATLVTIFEALHDMQEPTRVLRGLASVLSPGGAVLVADERVEDVFTAPAPDLDRLNYAFSVLHCLPATMSEGQGEANGTVLRAPTLTRWAADAGYARCDRLPIDSDVWSFYRLGVDA